MHPVTLILPSAWASYIAYGDDTGLEPHEPAIIDRVVKGYRLRGEPAEIGGHDFYFEAHDARYVLPQGAMCAAYTWLV